MYNFEKNSFSIGITLYYPSNQELNNIFRYTKVFSTVYVFDNTDFDEKQKYNEVYLKEFKNIVYLTTGYNNGLSIALNKMCQVALDDGYEFICLFDQDSIMNNEDFLKINNYIIKNNSSDIGIFTPKVVYNQSKIRNIKNEKNFSKEIEWAITSGSYINLNTYRLSGGFDENYFIDRLDYDYCLNLKKMGYKIVELQNVYLIQQLGQKIKFFNLEVSEHNEIRHYYMFRNRLYYYLRKNYSIRNLFIVLFLSFRHVIKIFFENNRIKKIKIIKISIIDFLKNKMGKIGI